MEVARLELTSAWAHLQEPLQQGLELLAETHWQDEVTAAIVLRLEEVTASPELEEALSIASGVDLDGTPDWSCRIGTFRQKAAAFLDAASEDVRLDPGTALGLVTRGAPPLFGGCRCQPAKVEGVGFLAGGHPRDINASFPVDRRIYACKVL